MMKTIQYEYDGNNNRTAVIKPEGNRWEYDFDVTNRLTHVRNVPEAITTTYTYDAADNLKTITDAENKVTTFAYDNRNRKTSKTYPDDKVITYDYDNNSNLTDIDLPNATSITYTYDNLNRQTGQSYTGTYGTASVGFTLDGNGNIEQVDEVIEGNSHVYTMAYDGFDRMERKTDRYGNSFDFSYDANGNRKVFKDHNNQLTSYTYDKLNRLKQMTNPNTGAFDWSYNSAGLPELLDYPNGSQANYSYDNANRIDVITHTQIGVPVATFDYDYDDNGNRVLVTQSNINSNESITYNYDDADRLTQVTYPNETNSYTLDKVGNRDLEVIDTGGILTTRDYDYNNRDQLITVTDNNGLDVSYDYDEAGNQTQKDENGQITSFDYSPRQRIETITQNGVTFKYTYDYLGNRTSKESQGQKTLFTYDGTSLLYETNTIGNVIAKYHYGSDRILAETSSGANQYLFHDALRTPIAITNQDGSIRNRIEYDAWGNRTDQTATDDHPFGFTGYQEDSDTGLYFAKARYYDPVEGVFLREDPLLGDINMPPSLHRYNYAASNPTYYIDPTGKANDVSHYYEALLIGKLVGLNEGQMYAYAIGAQIGDEFKHHDAIHNSTKSVLTKGLYTPYAKFNNCGAHALCGTKPSIVRDAVTDYSLNVAQNYAEIGTADHTNTDSYFHIQAMTLGTENEMLHSSIIGHLFEGKLTDKSWFYHNEKRKKAFAARAWLLFEHTTRQGMQTMDESSFEIELNKMLADMDKQRNNLMRKTYEEHFWVRDWAAKMAMPSDESEFESIKRLLAYHQINDVPETETHAAQSDINELLNKFTHNQLKQIAIEIDPSIEIHLDRMEEEHLITWLNISYDRAQEKSKAFVYAKVKAQEYKSEIVKENSNKPGSEEVSK